MLQQEKPEDFVIATGVQYSVREFVDAAAGELGMQLTWEGAGTEEPVPLNPPVPVYITYLTAMPSGSSIAFFDDVYGRDKARLAAIQTEAGPAATAAAR